MKKRRDDKMNKKLMCGLVLSVSLFSISAYAADGDNALTTKKYVNDGLSFVYGVANGTENGAVKTLKQQVGDSTTGLIKDVAGLQSAVGDGTTTGLIKDVNDLKETVGDGTTGLSKDVADMQNALSNGEGGLVDVGALQQTVSSLQSNSKTYSAGAGIKVTPGATANDPSTIGIALPNGATDGAKYVFQSDGAGGGTWTQMEVADTWNPSFLTNP